MCPFVTRYDDATLSGQGFADTANEAPRAVTQAHTANAYKG